MDEHKLRELLEAVQGGGVSLNDALKQLKKLPFEDLGHTKIDHHRGLRAGAPEVIYAGHKSPEQVVDIALQILKGGQNLLVTRTNETHREALRARLDLVTPDFDKSLELQIQKLSNFRRSAETEFAKPKYLGRFLKEAGTLAVWQHAGFMPADRKILILTAGTSDLNVAQEAAETARLMGCTVQTITDVGVAGVHRLLAHVDEIQQASVLIVIAGMEGALASVAGGLVDVPVIAVPTSVGYGASFQGVAALLSMLNSCSSTVSVVNIDNGFGAGYIASLHIRQLAREREAARSKTKGPNEIGKGSMGPHDLAPESPTQS